MNFSRIEEDASARGYRVDDGIVSSPNGKRLKPYLNQGGYPTISTGRQQKKCLVHRLAAYQKFGTAIYETGIDVRHMDSNRQNFHADNLELGTKSQNQLDKSPETRMRTAINASTHAIKHNHEAVKAHYAQTGSYKLTMAHFGISSKGTLHYLLNNRQLKYGSYPVAELQRHLMAEVKAS